MEHHIHHQQQMYAQHAQQHLLQPQQHSLPMPQPTHGHSLRSMDRTLNSTMNNTMSSAMSSVMNTSSMHAPGYNTMNNTMNTINNMMNNTMNSAMNNTLNANMQSSSIGDQSSTISTIVDNSQDADYEPSIPIKRGRGRPKGSGRGRGRPPKNPPSDRQTYTRQPVEHHSAIGTGLSDNQEPQSLFESVRQGRLALQSLVDEWIDSYRMERDTATLELLQFFLRSSGCLGRITPMMRESMDNTQIIRQMVEEFDEECGADYPLVMAGPSWKKFRVNFCEFVHVLIKQCQYSIIYDQYLMESLISWLISLSDSQVRAFRHTATLAAMKLMTALVDVALLLSINLDNTQRQFENERQKSRERRASERLDTLMNKSQEIEENIKDINLMLSYLFKSMFVHRYRDVVPEIRSICIYEIGVWMKRFPNHFLDDSYLKYVGWTLHDKVSDVRLKCLQALLPLYETEQIARKMELFTNKFKDRIVQMALDKEPEVAVQAIRLLIQIHKHHRDVLSDKDCENLYEIVYVTNRGMAQAAGEFLNERLFQVNDQLDIRSKRGKKRSPHTPLIRDLIQFFIESEFHEHASYLVDSLIDSHPMMKDWECMTDLLIEEAGPEEEPLDDKQETSLIEIMICCIRQSVTNEPPICRESNKRQLSSKEQKQMQDEKNRITEHFIHTLPRLLQKYQNDPEKVANLLAIPQYFELSMFTQYQSDLEELLLLINRIIDIHSDTEVLETCAKSYEYLYDEDYTFSRAVWLQKSSLIDMLIAKYRESLEAFNHSPNENESLVCTLLIKKLAILYSSHDLSSANIADDLFDRWVRQANQDGSGDLVPTEAIRQTIYVYRVCLIWWLYLLDEEKETHINDQELLEKAERFILEARRILLSNRHDGLCEDAFAAICDILIVFSPYQKKGKFPQLFITPEPSLIRDLETFLRDKVFMNDYTIDEEEMQNNERLENLHKKRKFLSGYSKLIAYNVIPISNSVIIIKNYVRFYDDYGDLIKTTLGKIREINKVICAKTMIRALTSTFIEIRNNSANNPNAFTKQDQDFAQLKELAKRFGLSFGLDNQKNRDAIATLHREGIVFTFSTIEDPNNPLGPPPNLPFLEIISEFSNKLIRQDKKTVIAYLDKCVKAKLPGVRDDEWQPLISYRNSLTQHNEFELMANRAAGRVSYSRGQNPEQDEEMNDEDM